MREETNRAKDIEKKKGLVAFDLDHTLLDHNKGAITPSSLEAIKLLKENGYLVVLASGRNMYDRYSYDYLKEIRSLFNAVKVRKPEASRGRSREVYIVASGFKGC